MPHPLVTVAIPTLAVDHSLTECLNALEAQTYPDFEVVVIDNSGAGRVESPAQFARNRVRVIANRQNAGFGKAVNQAWRASEAPLLAALNDDARPHPRWLEELVEAAHAHPAAGMFASQVRLGDSELLDSAGMRMAADGSAKQRGHREAASGFSKPCRVFFPSGSAALYRREMLDQTGMFDEDYFLYCEDTDLGLRGRWAGWDCLYVPGAVVEHAYSQSAGRASPLKAYYVERNRIATAIKTFPLRMLWKAPFAAGMRYGWHAVYLLAGRGAAADFRRSGHSGWMLPFLVIRAHVSALMTLPRLLGARGKVMRSRKISAAQFATLAAAHSISLRRVAEL